jgi:hypothetical protein
MLLTYRTVIIQPPAAIPIPRGSRGASAEGAAALRNKTKKHREIAQMSYLPKHFNPNDIKSPKRDTTPGADLLLHSFDFL